MPACIDVTEGSGNGAALHRKEGWWKSRIMGGWTKVFEKQRQLLAGFKLPTRSDSLLLWG
jgi:hypothetical protein